MVDPRGTPDLNEAILLVDGEVLVRHAIADYLRGCGYSVIEAATSDEAVAVLDEVSVRVDAVLCDVAVTGGLSGFDLCIWIKDKRPGLNVILSGSIAVAASAAAELCDRKPDVRRPYDQESVVDHIRKLLARRDAPAS